MRNDFFSWIRVTLYQPPPDKTVLLLTKEKEVILGWWDEYNSYFRYCFPTFREYNYIDEDEHSIEMRLQVLDKISELMNHSNPEIKRIITHWMHFPDVLSAG